MNIYFILFFFATILSTLTIKLCRSQNVTLRGTMINPSLKEEDFRVLSSWNANLIRWQLNWVGDDPADNATVSEYVAWLDTALKQFDAMLPVLRQLNLNIVLDLHTPPGGGNWQTFYRLFTEKQFQDCFLSVWEMMANKYKNESHIIGYDILNEPDDHSLLPGLMNWRELAISVVQRIRVIDSQHTIICEASPLAVSNTLPNFEPLPFDNIIYSFHMYEPYDFTYQNLNFNVTPIYYPGPIRGTMWNKEKLRSLLQPNVEWQKVHNVSIYVGEFSAIRWAPGNSTANYLNDLIELYEEFGWDWTYHAFREFQGWDVEMIGDKDHPQRSPTPTDRQLLLMEWFKKNKY
jgi:hypothetical protein